MTDFPYVQESTVSMLIHLPPYYLGNVMKGIEYKLNKFLMRFVEPIGGIVLGFWNIQLLETKGKIIGERPHIHFPIRCQFLSFVPTIGCLLIGKVNTIGVDYIGLLVLGIFNASIPKEEIPAEFDYDPSQECWYYIGDSSIQIKNESFIKFSIKSTNWFRGSFSIEGSLKDPKTGLLS